MRFANYKSRTLSHELSSDCVIARAKVRVRAQASYGNITVLSHLNPTIDWHSVQGGVAVLSVRFEVGVSLLLAPAGADKRCPKAPFPLVENAGMQLGIHKRVPTLFNLWLFSLRVWPCF